MPSHDEWAMEHRWVTAERSLATRPITANEVAAGPPVAAVQPGQPFAFCDAMRALCRDVVARCPTFAHIDLERVLISITTSRNTSPYGLQARVTPMRFRNGAHTRRFRNVTYRIQRYIVDEQEVLYVVTFCLPRYLDQSFDEKLVTVFHELYHIGPAFDGDLRRHPGRYTVHSHSKRLYDDRMAGLAKVYLDRHTAPEVFEFLRSSYAALCQRFGAVTGIVVPRPKLLPLAQPMPSAADED